MNKEIENIVLELNKLQIVALEMVKKDIEFVIYNKCINDTEIEHIFDKILDLAFWYGKEIDILFYDLYNYYKNINIDLCKNYESYYIKVLKNGSKYD